jgi:hypothetical protein
LRVAEQANEEKIIGKEHLPLDFGQAVRAKHATPNSIAFFQLREALSEFNFIERAEALCASLNKCIERRALSLLCARDTPLPARPVFALCLSSCSAVFAR